MSYAYAMDRMLNLGLPREVVVPILRKVEKWSSTNGPEWTVDRLKDLKLLFISFLSGQPFVPSHWLALGEDGSPKGCFKPIFKMKPSRKVFDLLLVYTSFVSKSVTKRQKEKFHSSMCAPVVGFTPHIPCLKIVTESVSKNLPHRPRLTYRDYPWSVSKRAPLPSMKTCSESKEILWKDFQSSSTWDLLDIPECEQVIADSMDDLYISLRQEREVESEFGDCVGRISVVQEPGFKARFLANPRRVYQVSLRPLGKQLFHLLAQLPWDCTYNQSAGVAWVQAQFLQGRLVHSVDLSDATNNFPFDLQMRVLRWMKDLEFSDLLLLQEVVRRPWFVPESLRIDPKVSKQSWTKGQPLGLYPSFPMFALTHGILVKSIEENHGFSDTFRVLGDDIVISNHVVYDEYRKILDLLQIPISEKKSISSTKVAEFAGMLITPDKCYSGVKWRQPTSVNRLKLISSLPRNLDLTDKEEFLSYIMRSAPKPYGDGMNPEGVSLKARMSLFLPWYLDILEKDGYEQLERPSLGSLRLSDQTQLQEVTVTRQEIEEYTQGILEKWNEVHPFTPIPGVDTPEDKRRKALSLSLWERITVYYGFPELEVPTFVLDGSWLKDVEREHGSSYFQPILSEAIKRNPIPWYRIRNQQIKNQLRFNELSPKRRARFLDTMLYCFLAECK